MKRKIIALLLLSIVLSACGPEKPRKLNGTELSVLTTLDKLFVSENNPDVVSIKYLDKHAEEYSELDFPNDIVYVEGIVERIEVIEKDPDFKEKHKDDPMYEYYDFDIPRYEVYLKGSDSAIKISDYDFSIKEGGCYLFEVSPGLYSYLGHKYFMLPNED